MLHLSQHSSYPGVNVFPPLSSVSGMVSNVALSARSYPRLKKPAPKYLAVSTTRLDPAVQNTVGGGYCVLSFHKC